MNRQSRWTSKVGGNEVVCEICGKEIDNGSAFVDQPPTNWNDPSARKRRRFVPKGTDIHGWTPFVATHPECFSEREGQDALDQLRLGHD